MITKLYSFRYERSAGGEMLPTKQLVLIIIVVLRSGEVGACKPVSCLRRSLPEY